MGIQPERYIHHARSLQNPKPRQHTKRSHLGKGMDPRHLAQSFYIPMAYWASQNPYLGQFKKKENSWALYMPKLPLPRGNATASLELLLSSQSFMGEN